MALSEAKKRANRRWDAEHMHIFSVKVTNRDADAFRAAAAREGLTPHGALLRAVREMIARHAGEVPSVEPEEPRR